MHWHCVAPWLRRRVAQGIGETIRNGLGKHSCPVARQTCVGACVYSFPLPSYQPVSGLQTWRPWLLVCAWQLLERYWPTCPSAVGSASSCSQRRPSAHICCCTSTRRQGYQCWNITYSVELDAVQWRRLQCAVHAVECLESRVHMPWTTCQQGPYKTAYQHCKELRRLVIEEARLDCEAEYNKRTAVGIYFDDPSCTPASKCRFSMAVVQDTHGSTGVQSAVLLEWLLSVQRTDQCLLLATPAQT